MPAPDRIPHLRLSVPLSFQRFSFQLFPGQRCNVVTRFLLGSTEAPPHRNTETPSPLSWLSMLDVGSSGPVVFLPVRTNVTM
jgi:hypothetical protein